MLPYFKIGHFVIYTYSIILGFLIGFAFYFGKYLLALHKRKFESYNLFYLGLVLSSWIGAKVFFLLNVNTEILNKALVSQSFWLGGGFVFYGGLIFGLIYTIAYGLKKHFYYRKFEFLVPDIVLCHAIGRLGCFLAGCCYGSHCELPWAINLHGQLRHPVQIYESILLFVLSIWLFKRYKQKQTIFLEYLLSYGVIRFILEFFRGDEIRGVYLFGLSTSQIISLIVIIILGSYNFIWARKK